MEGVFYNSFWACFLKSFLLSLLFCECFLILFFCPYYFGYVSVIAIFGHVFSFHNSGVYPLQPIWAKRCPWSKPRCARIKLAHVGGAVFLFFIFVFHKNTFSFSKFTGIYPGRPAAGRPGPGRPAAGRQGLLCKNFCENICAQVPEGRSPGSGAASPGRPAAGRPDLGLAGPPPLICITKITETKKKEGGRERGEALPDFRAGDCR